VKQETKTALPSILAFGIAFVLILSASLMMRRANGVSYFMTALALLLLCAGTLMLPYRAK